MCQTAKMFPRAATLMLVSGLESGAEIPQAMAVLGSDITIDLYSTVEADVETVQNAVQQGRGVNPHLEAPVRRAIDETATGILEDEGITAYDLSFDLEVVHERVPGAPRERIQGQLDVEGDDSVLASVDEAIGARERARLADATEEVVLEHLAGYDLADHVDVIVIITPSEFR